MRNYLSTTVGLVSLLALPAWAHDYSTDLFCEITDTAGQTNQYTFANNSSNADGSNGGTFVETRYSSNTKTVVSPRGLRPIWVFDENGLGGLTIISREAPGWRIVMGPIGKRNGVYGAQAILQHNGQTVGRGGCVHQAAQPDNELPTAGDIEDLGGE